MDNNLGRICHIYFMRQFCTEKNAPSNMAKIWLRYEAVVAKFRETNLNELKIIAKDFVERSMNKKH